MSWHVSAAFYVPDKERDEQVLERRVKAERRKKSFEPRGVAESTEEQRN